MLTGNAWATGISAWKVLYEKLDNLATVQLFTFAILLNNSILFDLYNKLCLNFSPI